MTNFSIESKAEQIPIKQTRVYFEEVMKTYNNGNLRSSVVMLWSVVVCDLVFKLTHVYEVHQDNKAKALLDEIKLKQTQNPTSTDWEAYLLKEVSVRTDLLNNVEYTELSDIQLKRHLSAHPILSEANILYEPTPELARALIRSALDLLLTKPALLVDKVSTRLVVDLAQEKNILIGDKILKKYLDAKFFKFLSPEARKHLFKDLWKFCFKLNNAEANENRDINYRALELLYKENKVELREYISQDSEMLSSLISEHGFDHIFLLLTIDPHIYSLLTPDAQVQIDALADENLDNYCLAFFKETNLADHVKKILDKVQQEDYIDHSDGISERNWGRFITVCEQNDLLSESRELAIELYSRSQNFRTGDVFFNRYIRVAAGKFSKTELTDLIQKSENNGETTGRGTRDHEFLLSKNKQVLSGNFDWSPYPRWKRAMDST